MEDARTSTSPQRLAFDTLIESPDADITSIPVVSPESFPEGSNRDIPVSVQELVYGSKAAGVGTSAKSLDRHNELLTSSEEFHGTRKDRRNSERLDNHFLQGTSPTDKSFVEKSKHFVRGQEVCPRKGRKPSGSSSSFHKQKSASTSAKKGQENLKEQSEGQAKGKGKSKIQVEQALPTELQSAQAGGDSHGQCV
ncbi:hypothetical protein O181_087295 [Austropuccinia psidii MF-1]|uniref:Uncharacterized protein n=1 Tax=Austropuccinia psidii MF-1 TaxID=1389203 RepID=A0A9Q3P1L9_9BASI|nr:hypothetical protein [Austropuccinia psidii MF-1]